MLMVQLHHTRLKHTKYETYPWVHVELVDMVIRPIDLLPAGARYQRGR
jgi:hypothetical protein